MAEGRAAAVWVGGAGGEAVLAVRPVKWAVLPVWADEQGVGTLVGFVIPGAADVGHGEGGDGASDVADGEVAVAGVGVDLAVVAIGDPDGGTVDQMPLGAWLPKLRSMLRSLPESRVL